MPSAVPSPRRATTAGFAPAAPELVVVPGLGALGYLLPLVRACAGWTRVHLLDVPGFGDRRTARLPADVDSVSRTVAAWLTEVAQRPVLLLEGAARSVARPLPRLVSRGRGFWLAWRR